MRKYVALLRGINVGGRIIKMADLKACFEDMGFKDVSTLLQSGNVLFKSDGKADKLRVKLELVVGKRFGYDASILVYSMDEIKKILEGYPFDEKENKFQHYVIFIDDKRAGELVGLAPNSSLAERIKQGRGSVYWQVKKGMTLKSEFSKHLTKAKLKPGSTVRNTRTLLKIIK